MRGLNGIEFKNIWYFYVIMRIGYTIASTKSGEEGLLWRAQKPTGTTDCPIIDFDKASEFVFLPQGRAQRGKEAGETLSPLAQPSREAQQDIGQRLRHLTRNITAGTERNGVIEHGCPGRWPRS